MVINKPSTIQHSSPSCTNIAQALCGHEDQRCWPPARYRRRATSISITIKWVGFMVISWTCNGNMIWRKTYEPCSKCLTSWHQIRKCLRHCLRFAYARTRFAYAHTLSYAELVLAYAHHSFAYATPLQGLRTCLMSRFFGAYSGILCI